VQKWNAKMLARRVIRQRRGGKAVQEEGEDDRYLWRADDYDVTGRARAMMESCGGHKRSTHATFSDGSTRGGPTSEVKPR